MATGLTKSDTSNLSSGQRIVISAAKKAYEPAAPDPDLVEGERIGVGEKQWDINTYARLADATSLSEGVDLSQVHQLVTANLSITPSENGIIVTPSKRLMRRQGDGNIQTISGQQIAESLRRLQAKNVISLYDQFSKTTVGAGSTLDITHFRASVAYLMTDNDSAYGPAQPPFNAALHIEQISDIILDITDPSTVAAGSSGSITDRSGLSAEMLQRWWKGSDRLYGVAIFHSGNIARDGSDDAKGAIFASGALYLVMANDADVTEEPDNSARIVEFGIFQEWGTGERADSHGIEIYSDAEATV